MNGVFLANPCISLRAGLIAALSVRILRAMVVVCFFLGRARIAVSETTAIGSVQVLEHHDDSREINWWSGAIEGGGFIFVWLYPNGR